MPSRSQFLKHIFGGGWATDYGPTAFVGISATKKVQLPWLNEAENVIYELDGGPHLMPGTTKNNAVVLESGTKISGIYDAWFTGTAGTPAQHRIMHISTKIKKDNANNTFTDLFTGMTAGAVPCYTMFEDLLILSNDSGTDVPKSWDGTTAQSLAGSPPTFAFSCVHKNKVWAAGAIANPSRLYYSVTLNPADWAGAGSGSIDIDPSDGDRITGIASFRDELWVFKGPYKGAIHRITGSSPSDFARTTFVTGVGSVNHNGIVPYGNDLGFTWSDGTFRSLQTTAAFGDFEESAVSRPINTWLREHVTLSSLKYAMAVNWPEYGIVLFSLPIDASTQNNCMLMMDYRFDPPRWAKWSAIDFATSLASAVDASQSNKRVILIGGDDGYLRTFGSSTRSIDGVTSIPYNVVTPFLDYDIPDHMKTLNGGSVTFNPKNAQNITFGWTRDSNTQQTQSVSQGGTDSVLDSFLLDTSILGGGRFHDAFFRTEDGGEFRAIQYQLLSNATGFDVEAHAISTNITLGAESYENV